LTESGATTSLPANHWAVIGFLALVVMLAGLSDEVEVQASFYAVPAIVIAIAVGWWLVSHRQQR
jgi:L-asparagine permease